MSLAFVVVCVCVFVCSLFTCSYVYTCALSILWVKDCEEAQL